jgi:flagellar hook-associated protein 3 FlgL
MRVTESMLLGQLVNNVDTSSSSYQNLQQQLATGRKINNPSDDPTGASQAMSIRSVLVNIAQYQSNATGATSVMQYTDSQLQVVDNLVQQARTIAVSAANGGTQDASTEQANTAQINSIISQLTTIANSDFNGQKIFSGQQTTTNAFTPGDNTFTYNGDDNAITATIGNGTTVQTNIPGDKIFSPIFTALSQLSTDISSNNATAISNNDLPAIDTSLTAVNTSRATLGVNMDSVQTTVNMLGTTQQNYQTSLAGLEDVDIASVYAQLQVAQNTYQASLVATQKALQYSLATYIQ